MRRLATTVLSVSILALLASAAPAAEGRGAGKDEGKGVGKLPEEFTGKVLVLLLSTGDTVVVEKGEMRDIGGRAFLLGTRVETGDKDEAHQRVRCGVSWDTVDSFDVFDTVEQYLKSTGKTKLTRIGHSSRTTQSGYLSRH
jgi:hypothetical protein